MPRSAVNILKQKSVLIIVPPSNFSDEEFTYLYSYLKNAKVKVKVASISKKASGLMGTEVKPDVKLSDVKVKDYDAIVVIGECGISKHNLSGNQELLKLVKKANTKKKIVAATCMAPKIMAAADVIRGKVITAWRDPSLVNLLKEKGASYIWEPVVSDENIITTDSPSSVRTFAEMLIDALTR
jgi:protease I